MGEPQLDRLSSVFEKNCNGREKRRFPRYQVDVRVRVEVFHSGKRRIALGRGSDLSQQGMCLFLPLEIDVHTILNLELTLPYSSQPLNLKAVVRNRRSFAYGIEFLDISAAQQAVIERTCRSLALLQ